MSRRAELYIFAALILLVAYSGYYYFSSRTQLAGLPGVFAANTKFQPLDVQEPRLHLDLLERVRKMEYSGSHRNIFSATPPPIEKPKTETSSSFMGPHPAPPPPPVQVPAEFFGYAWRGHSQNRVAFFTSGDDVLVVHEGDTFLDRFRLDHIGNDSADVEEISSGRHATVPLVQPPDQGPTQQ
jgi:hypothetical protein